jgi:preprotein translocase subunit Sss1
MGPSHGGMQRSLEMMKQMARSGGKPDRDEVEDALPYIVLGLVGIGVVCFLLVRAVMWLS